MPVNFDIKNLLLSLLVLLAFSSLAAQNFYVNENGDTLMIDIDEVKVSSKNGSQQQMRRLRSVEGMGIFAAKKSEVILLENMVANLATNNSRQAYRSIAGLNIWESDGAGLQLSIGARGLDPNRTANFNTRQNGYDISADALGYPESYYTPPLQAVEKIEIVRGAASLQFGTQFGGLLNFQMKRGDDAPIKLQAQTTVGSYGLLNGFFSLGGTSNGLNYYAYAQRKQGNGWRSNSQFHQNNAYASLSKTIAERFSISAEITFMNYLAQQAGGLQDFQFYSDARQSFRERNWFRVDWLLGALNFDYKISEATKLNSRFFALKAQRQSLGELGPANRPDPLRERSLVKGSYHNIGNETRLLSRYKIGSQYNNFLIGLRLYSGNTTNTQGLASDASDADFSFLFPDEPDKSDYRFPSKNAALFMENLFNVTERWSITPGIRLEHISTSSEGYFFQRVVSGGQVILEEKIPEERSNARSFAIIGLGTAYRFQNEMETYANFSQNYRSINFTDMVEENSNLQIDDNLEDERGYNADLGVRGSMLKGKLRFDLGVFYLRYANRIGLTEIISTDEIGLEMAVPYRSNIGTARIWGFESYLEFDFVENKDFLLTYFSNFSLLNGKYLSGGASVIGNQVEMIPPASWKTGINFKWKNLAVSYQYSYTGAHFSDASNATFVADATRGMIDVYQLHDLSLRYKIKNYSFEFSINNLMNSMYFTRRAVSYPGPGIIPGEGRSFYVTFGLEL